MRSTTFLAAVAIACASVALATRRPLLDQPKAGETPLPSTYVESVRAGEAALERGDLEQAEAAFSRAAAIDLPEVPNYEVLIRLAEIKCLRSAGDAQDMLSEFTCMLDVDEGKKSCFDRTPDGGIGDRNPEITPQCFERMCGEIYLPYYEHPTTETLAKTRGLRDELNRVERLCTGQSGNEH